MNIQNQIKKIMDKKLITSYQISKQINISESQLSKFFTGKCSISLSKLEQLVDFIGCEIKILEK